jgi:hypothetical protein
VGDEDGDGEGDVDGFAEGDVDGLGDDFDGDGDGDDSTALPVGDGVCAAAGARPAEGRVLLRDGRAAADVRVAAGVVPRVVAACGLVAGALTLGPATWA